MEYSKSIVIVDARPKVNAVGNAVARGGFESTDVYTCADFKFGKIANIHVVREAFTGLRDIINSAVFDRMSKSPKADLRDQVRKSKDGAVGKDSEVLKERYKDVLIRLRTARGGTKSKWLYLVSKILEVSANVVVFMINDRLSVLVHCSDGWDRTAQVCSLAELMMDSYYRTIRGFAVLIEKEWLSFGHKFAERCGHASIRDPFDKQRSPIFIQWVDCVFQLVIQFPDEFEFTPQFLVDLVDAVYSCKYGTFLYNTEKERVETNLYKCTTSVWTELLAPSKKQYRNTTFKSTSQKILNPVYTIEHLNLFLHLYKRWDSEADQLDNYDCNEFLTVLGESAIDIPRNFDSIADEARFSSYDDEKFNNFDEDEDDNED